MTPGQLEERYDAWVDRQKNWFHLMQLAVNRGMGGEFLDPEELFQRVDPAEPAWKRETRKIDEILPDEDIES